MTNRKRRSVGCCSSGRLLTGSAHGVYILLCKYCCQAYEKHESMLQPQKKKATVALRECIELFTTMETLGEHDPW